MRMGCRGVFLLSQAHERFGGETGESPEEEEILGELRSLWTGEEKLLLSRCPNGVAYKQEFADVRDVVQGLVLALEMDAAVGEEFTLGGAAVFRWDEHVPWFAARYGLEFVNARLPESNFFEFDLSKIRGLLGMSLGMTCGVWWRRRRRCGGGRRRGWCRRGSDMAGKGERSAVGL